MRYALKVSMIAVFMFVVALTLSASTYYSTSGTVYSKESVAVQRAYPCGPNGAWTCYVTEHHLYLKINEPDNDKVKAECVGSTLQTCNDLAMGQQVVGVVEFNAGFGTWIYLEATN